MENKVFFKGTQDGINISVKDYTNLNELKESLKTKLKNSKQFFNGENVNIKLTGHDFNTEEENIIFDLIEEYANLNIAFIGNEKYFTKKNIDKQKNNNNFSHIYNDTYFHKGTLRSGDIINYEGSVVIFGDTNPGSEINAYGNIIVQGKIGGVVHAGFLGNRECYISAFNLSAIQLRIADIITFVPDEIINENKKKFIPRYAYIENNQIYISKIKK